MIFTLSSGLITEPEWLHPEVTKENPGSTAESVVDTLFSLVWLDERAESVGLSAELIVSLEMGQLLFVMQSPTAWLLSRVEKIVP